MKNICSRCNGTGYEEYDENYRTFYDSCYHCGESGYVNEETHWHDQLADVAKSLAYYHVSEMRNHINSDPDGEGWDFHAAENMMTGSDYFQAKCWNYEDIFIQQLMDLPFETQQVLVAWDEFNKEEKYSSFTNLDVPSSTDTIPHSHMDVWGVEDNDVLF